MTDQYFGVTPPGDWQQLQAQQQARESAQVFGEQYVSESLQAAQGEAQRQQAAAELHAHAHYEFQQRYYQPQSGGVSTATPTASAPDDYGHHSAQPGTRFPRMMQMETESKPVEPTPAPALEPSRSTGEMAFVIFLVAGIAAAFVGNFIYRGQAEDFSQSPLVYGCFLGIGFSTTVAYLIRQFWALVLPASAAVVLVVMLLSGSN